jgi:hypothetical protein
MFPFLSLVLDDFRSRLKNVFWCPAARVPAKPLGEVGILNQNPIFEMAPDKDAFDCHPGIV